MIAAAVLVAAVGLVVLAFVAIRSRRPRPTPAQQTPAPPVTPMKLLTDAASAMASSQPDFDPVWRPCQPLLLPDRMYAVRDEVNTSEGAYVGVTENLRPLVIHRDGRRVDAQLLTIRTPRGVTFGVSVATPHAPHSN